MRMTFGKHKGKELDEIPDSYLLWVLEKAESAPALLKAAIRRHLGIEDPFQARPPPPPPPRSGPMVTADMVARWYRTLAMKFHPDRGGSHEAMQALNAARDALMRDLGL